MRKNILFALFVSLVLFCTSCSDNDVILLESQNVDAVHSRSLSASSEHYYYYKGKKISLNVHPTKRYVVVKQDESANVATFGIKSTQDSYYVNETHRGYVVDIDTVETARTATNMNTLSSLANDDNVVAIEYVVGNSILTPISNKFYVKLKKLSDISLLEKYADAIECEMEGAIETDEYWICLSSNKKSRFNSLEASNFMYETGDFDAVDPGFIYNINLHAVPTDANYNSQWNLRGAYGIGAEQAWNITKGNSDITVAVIDGGIASGHPDLVGRLHNYSYNSGNGIDLNHGTMVAGIIGANHNTLHIAGIAPNVKLMNIAINFSSPQHMADCINNAWKNGADVINNSWGVNSGEEFTNGDLVESAINNALTKGREGKGCIVVFSSGNEENISYPAWSIPDIIVVGATNINGYVTNFSGKGSTLDVVAPGENILSLSSSSVMTDSGTSFAAPHVSGLAALILSLNSDLTQSQVNTIIKETARNKTWNQSYGWGIINATKALQVVQGNYSIMTASPGSGRTVYAQQAKFYIPNLPASASVAWSTNSNAATIKSCSNDTIVFEYTFASRTMTDNVNATVTYCGMTSQLTLPITVTNDPLIIGVERMVYYDQATDRVDFKVTCTDPDATFEWGGSYDWVDFPYANDAMFMDHPNWYKSLMVPNYSMNYNLFVTATNQYGSHTYYFDYTHNPTMIMRSSEEEQEQENKKEEQQ